MFALLRKKQLITAMTAAISNPRPDLFADRMVKAWVKAMMLSTVMTMPASRTSRLPMEEICSQGGSVARSEESTKSWYRPNAITYSTVATKMTSTASITATRSETESVTLD